MSGIHIACKPFKLSGGSDNISILSYIKLRFAYGRAVPSLARIFKRDVNSLIAFCDEAAVHGNIAVRRNDVAVNFAHGNGIYTVNGA